MEPKTNPEGPRVNLKDTTPIISDDGNVVFAEGLLLRKVSRFLVGGGQDQIIPLPCMYDVKTGRLLIDSLPPEVQEEYKELIETSK